MHTNITRFSKKGENYDATTVSVLKGILRYPGV